MSPPDLFEADAMLARAAKNAFARAERLQQFCMEAETVAEAVEASRGCDHAERSMRQQLILLARIQRSRRADNAELRRRDGGRRKARAEALSSALRRVICAERAETEERLELIDQLDDLVDPQRAPDDFADRPFHAQVLELAQALGLDREAAETWADLPPADDRLPGEDGHPDDPELHGDLSHLPYEERCRLLARAGVFVPDSS